jgi:hypothetical protein
MKEVPFVQEFKNLGKWDNLQVIEDVKKLITSTGADWDTWQTKNLVTLPEYNKYNYCGDINLTSNNTLCPTVEDRIWKYSGRIFKEDREIDDGDLHTLLPELEGTYTGNMISEFKKKFGPVRVRLHNRANKEGLYWHRDGHADLRYHLVLWTNPGHFLVWTDKHLQYEPSFSEDDCREEFDIQGKFLPANGSIYGLTTQKTHGVVNIGVGYNPHIGLQTRCHLTFWPVDPYNRY